VDAITAAMQAEPATAPVLTIVGHLLMASPPRHIGISVWSGGGDATCRS
jgi:hypothetical protein